METCVSDAEMGMEIEKEELFNRLMDGDEGVHEGRKALVRQYRELDEASFAAGMLEVLKNAGLELTEAELREYLHRRLRRQQQGLESRAQTPRG